MGVQRQARLSASKQSSAGELSAQTDRLLSVDAPDASVANKLREANIKAMLSDTVETERQAVLPRFLKVRTHFKLCLCESPMLRMDTIYVLQTLQAAWQDSAQNTASMYHASQRARWCLERHPTASKRFCMQIREAEKQLKKPFEGVREGKPAQTQDLKRRLSAMRRFVPWGGGSNFVPAHLQKATGDDEDVGAEEEASAAPEQKPVELELPEGVEPLYVWQPGAGPMDAVSMRYVCVATRCFDEVNPTQSERFHIVWRVDYCSGRQWLRGKQGSSDLTCPFPACQ
jgi:hypothetical protein